ncbi:sialic acid-binding Ig-like lectin 5 isoform X1 [Nannospalax galili]|uniref:sialic acid-binding Ig-like lectin 5 isoform X1 n=1 Tax=Nannospalax galili TaxID=1026970 RepID=UPI00111BD3BA|nr:sialic acid-binding Ig-like lectin 5 isoform X1 [Nannospalax galili]
MPRTGSSRHKMLALLLLPLLWAGSLARDPSFSLQVPESVTVQEGLCVLVPCSFSYPQHRGHYNLLQPLHIAWFWEEDNVFYDDPVATDKPDREVKTETKGRFHLVGDTKTNNCSLSITGARREDRRRYVLYIERGKEKYIYREKLNLRVTALTEKPIIHLEEPLQAGRPANLSCSLPGSCRGGGRISFSWIGDVINSMDPRTLRKPGLAFTPRPQDHDTNLTCQVKLERPLLTTERTVQLSVSYAPQNLSISLFFSNGTDLKITHNASSLMVRQGQDLQLRCEAQSNPPVQLSWCQESPSQNASCDPGNGTLELFLAGPAEARGLTCLAQNAVGSTTLSLNFFLVSPPRMLGPSCSWEAEGLHCSCSCRAWPAPSLHWRLGEGLLEGNSSNVSFTVTSSSTGPWANGSLSLHGGFGSNLRLSCEAQNDFGAQRGTVLLLAGKPECGERGSQVLAALGGAGAMALLCLCVCFTFLCIVKTRKLQATGRSKGMDDEDSVMGTVNWGARQEPWPDSPGNQVSPAVTVPSSEQQQEKQQELHYASLNFQGIKFKEPQEATSSTEYSEIKTSK